MVEGTLNLTYFQPFQLKPEVDVKSTACLPPEES